MVVNHIKPIKKKNSLPYRPYSVDCGQEHSAYSRYETNYPVKAFTHCVAVVVWTYVSLEHTEYDQNHSDHGHHVTRTPFSNLIIFVIIIVYKSSSLLASILLCTNLSKPFHFSSCLTDILSMIFHCGNFREGDCPCMKNRLCE